MTSKRGLYITDRYLPRIIRELCAQKKISVRTFSDDWVIELSSGEQSRRIAGYTFDINSAAAAAIANDKVAAYQLMVGYGISAVEHRLFRPGSNVPFIAPTWQPLVVKPLSGTGGNDVYCADDWRLALERMSVAKTNEWAISPYVEIVREVRNIILDGEILLSYEKIIIDKSDSLFKLFNLGKGALPRLYKVSHDLRILACGAQAAIGLRLASVDCVELSTGDWLVLEVNAGIMMEHYARTSPEHYRQAAAVYGRIIDAMMEIHI
jgi:glutathione synthase/RimK-type ligase-like ATP-grasp enzyme